MVFSNCFSNKGTQLWKLTTVLKAYKLSLKLLLPYKQLLNIFDTTEHAAGSVHLIADFTVNETGETGKFPSVALDSKWFSTGQISLSLSG